VVEGRTGMTKKTGCILYLLSTLDKPNVLGPGFVGGQWTAYTFAVLKCHLMHRSQVHATRQNRIARSMAGCVSLAALCLPHFPELI
jgi:hypothetical protein